MSLNVLLLNNGEDSDSIRTLIHSKIPKYSIAFHVLPNPLERSLNRISKIINDTKYDLCVLKETVVAQKFISQINAAAIVWDDMRDLSAKLDVFLQLHRYKAQYPLNLRDWKLTKVLHNSQDCIIYQASDDHKTIAAIKRFKFKPTELSRESIDEYLEVISKQCGIRSHGLMDFYEGGICNNAFYLVMEYLSYGNLRQFLDSIDCVLPLNHALEWFKEIASALAVVHQAGLIHRDLKVDNIMLREDGSLALTDYGVSKNILLNAGFLAEDEFHGSPYYVSPELIAGELCSQSSDIYSLGIIFYELLTGSRPYNANNTHDLLMAHIVESIPELPEDLSSFQSCLDKMMAKNPDERFNDVTEVLASFECSCEATRKSNRQKNDTPHLLSCF